MAEIKRLVPKLLQEGQIVGEWEKGIILIEGIF